ncbi:MAG: class I tRNA ligase family protein, partial [Clostridia bacterium]|nr:class I tRNA ligase family protein [Clostridia bacterium]
DIIPFWVMRMMFSGLEHTGQVPFDKVFIHGLVRDSQGRKMSKSLGNGIDPLEIISEYGADALRFTLATGNSPGNDMRFYTERVEASRNFANKIWNASRFLMMNLSIDKIELPDESQLKLEDKWILSKYNTLVKEVTENLDKFELGVAVSKLYDCIWDNYCDWYIELVKPRLYEKDGADKVAQNVLSYVLIGSLKLLHPFMPFITEEIFQSLPTGEDSIMVSAWSEYSENLCFTDAEKRMQIVMDTIRSVRNIRSQMNVVPSRKAKLIIVTDNTAMFENTGIYFEKLASASETVVTSDKSDVDDNAVNVVVEGATIYIPLDELVDRSKEIERLEKELKTLEAEIKRVEGKLGNAGFVAKAPAHVVEEEKAKGEKYAKMLSEVKLSLEKLK